MRILITSLLSIVMMAACTQGGESDRVEDLLEKMTIEEKVGQLIQYTGRWEMTGPAPDNEYARAGMQKIESGELGSMLNVTGARATRNAQKLAIEKSRLGIPMIFGYDVIHGYRTMFPMPLAEAATWEPELARQTSRVAAIEAAAAGLHWTFAPMVDIARDARWGRIVEGSGEDPYLGSLFAAARVRGFQGEDLSADNTIAACAKHFAAYGFVEAGREYNTVDVTEHTLQNIIFPPFKACVDAGVATFMNAFNVIGGIPSTGNTSMVRGLLKESWGFDGFVVSDWNSVGEMVEHGVAKDQKEAARLAIEAGCDMDMEGYCYERHLKELIETGEVDEKELDDAVRRILRVKEKLGLFDDPYRYCDEEREKETLLHPDHLALAREVGKRSLVLLKNSEAVLPLKKNGQKIVLIGELAGEKDSPLGNWRAQAIPNSAVSVLEGMQGKAEGSQIIFEKGPRYVTSETGFLTPLEINTTDPRGIREAVAAAAEADVAVLVLGENCFQSAEARSVTDISLKGFQKELLDAVLKVNDQVVLVLMNGRPLDISAFIDRIPAVLVAWHPGSESGNAIADVLFGDYNPSGRLPLSWPRSVGQLPLYYNAKNTGRPTDERNEVNTSRYIDLTNDPLFPFGFGLSYTEFEYSNLVLSSSSLSQEKSIEIRATITNTGEVFGEELVQLYIRDMAASVSRPVRELKGFQKIGLDPGQSEEVTFSLETDDLVYFGSDRKWGIDPGTIRVWIAPNASEGLETSFEIE